VGSGNRIYAGSGSRVDREGNRADEIGSRTDSPHGNRRGVGVTSTEIWRKARKLEQAGEAETRRQASLGRDAEDELEA
jgi:hypothetical protein